MTVIILYMITRFWGNEEEKIHYEGDFLLYKYMLVGYILLVPQNNLLKLCEGASANAAYLIFTFGQTSHLSRFLLSLFPYIFC